MTSKHTTLYLWDLAGTLFHEHWDAEKTGYPDLRSYLIGKGIAKEDMSDLEYERHHETTYKEGWSWQLSLQPGFREMLTWAHEHGRNATFSTGNVEQVDWRAEYLNPQVGYDIREYFDELHSTFEYGNTNAKTKEMLVDFLTKKYTEGFRTVVYTDDKLPNCELFKAAAEDVRRLHTDFSYRLYFMKNDHQGLREHVSYLEAGDLSRILEHEQHFL